MPYVVESIYPDKTPGTSLYVFHERSAVALNITWFWQCVVLSEAGEDGGVTNQWLEKLTNPTSDEQLECNNFDNDVTTDISLTMKKRLQTAGGKGGALFKMFEQTTDAGTVDVVADVRQVIQFALNELRLGSTQSNISIPLNTAPTISLGLPTPIKYLGLSLEKKSVE